MNRVKLILVMALWGSLGVFTKSIPLSALHLAFLRALFALPVLFIAMRVKKARRSRSGGSCIFPISCRACCWASAG